MFPPESGVTIKQMPNMQPLRPNKQAKQPPSYQQCVLNLVHSPSVTHSCHAGSASLATKYSGQAMQGLSHM